MNPPRQRTTSRGLPENLRAKQVRGVTYYVYTRPDTRKESSLGRDRAKAVQAAQILNARFATGEARVKAMVETASGQRDPIPKLVEAFIEKLPTLRRGRNRALARSTMAQYKRQLRAYAAYTGQVPVSSITRRQVAEFLATMPHHSSNRHRAALSLFFKHAVADGYLDDNPVRGTLPKPEVITRKRLTLDVYRAIYELAPHWFQCALDLGLQTLQRRHDLVLVKFSDLNDGWLNIRQHKTGAMIRIEVGPPLEAVIARCRDDIASPYMLHRAPLRRHRRYLSGKDHWTQITPDHLTKEFHKLRDRTGLVEGMPPNERPTFHEVRSLGASLYRKAGADPQPLLGHSSAVMTARYLEDHDVWTEAVAGLEIK